MSAGGSPPGDSLALTQLELEAGVDRAQALLDRYDPRTRVWDVDKTSEFWRTTAPLRTTPPPARRPTVAVIDSAFDVSIPALAEQTLASPNDPSTPTVHGTTVALTVLEVVPWLQLVLYPAARDGRLDAELAAAAIDDAVARGVDVVNLSMSVRRPVDEWYDSGLQWALRDRAVDDLTVASYEISARFPSDLWISVPPTPVGDAARRAVASGVQVVAATGNANRTLATPAALPGVVAAAFISEVRETAPNGMELAGAGVPSYAQSSFCDVALIQPPEVLGSSFATPMFSAVIAATCTADDVARYLDVVRIHGAGAQMMAYDNARVDDGPGHDAVTWWTFRRALARLPHRHDLSPADAGPCVPCAVFAVGAYVDGGLFALQTDRLDEAEPLLRAVRGFAPTNAHAAADLAVLLAERADRVTPGDAASLEHRRALLSEAVHHMAHAVERRPGHPAYAEQLASFRRGVDDPAHWSRRGPALR